MRKSKENTIEITKRKVENMRKSNTNTIKIKEEVRIPGTDYILEAGDKIEVLQSFKKDLKEKISMEGKTPYGFYADYFIDNESGRKTLLKRNNEAQGEDFIEDRTPYEIEKVNINSDESICFSVLVWNDEQSGFYITWFAFDNVQESTRSGW